MFGGWSHDPPFLSPPTQQQWEPLTGFIFTNPAYTERQDDDETGSFIFVMGESNADACQI